MKSKLLLGLLLVLTGDLFGWCNISRADTGFYDSVEWLTAMADQIGVYQAERIYGPHSVTNASLGESCCFYTAKFNLLKPFRGNPPGTFPRTRSVLKPGDLGFHVGDTYVFFFVAEERLKNVRANVGSTSEAFFIMWDYIWLERPQGERNGVAIDHKGRVLTGREEILRLVETSLKLPRADPSIDRWSYFYGNDKSKYPDNTHFNFHVITFPTPQTFPTEETWARYGVDSPGLVIPECLYETAAQTNLDVMMPHERIPPIANADPSIRHPISVRVPTKLDIRRTGDSLAIRFTSFQSTNLTVGTNMVVGLKVEKKLYPASGGRTKGSYSVSGGVIIESHPEAFNDAFTMDRDNIPQPGVKYTYKYQVEVFETDIPGQHMWSPEGGKYYKVLWTKVFKGTIKPRWFGF